MIKRAYFGFYAREGMLGYNLSWKIRKARRGQINAIYGVYRYKVARGVYLYRDVSHQTTDMRLTDFSRRRRWGCADAEGKSIFCNAYSPYACHATQETTR